MHWESEIKKYENSQPLEASEKADEQQRDHYQEKSNK
jgi:hypothetical protein